MPPKKVKDEQLKDAESSCAAKRSSRKVNEIDEAGEPGVHQESVGKRAWSWIGQTSSGIVMEFRNSTIRWYIPILVAIVLSRGCDHGVATWVKPLQKVVATQGHPDGDAEGFQWADGALVPYNTGERGHLKFEGAGAVMELFGEPDGQLLLVFSPKSAQQELDLKIPVQCSIICGESGAAVSQGWLWAGGQNGVKLDFVAENHRITRQLWFRDDRFGTATDSGGLTTTQRLNAQVAVK